MVTIINFKNQDEFKNKIERVIPELDWDTAVIRRRDWFNIVEIYPSTRIILTKNEAMVQDAAGGITDPLVIPRQSLAHKGFGTGNRLDVPWWKRQRPNPETNPYATANR